MANRAPDFFRGLDQPLLKELEEFAREPGRQGDEVVEWLAAKGVTASRSAVYRWLQGFRPENHIGSSRAPDFFRQLNERALEDLEEFARQPGRTGEEILEWLQERKIQASRSAVYRWLQDFRLTDRTRRASEVARSYLDSARQSDPTAVSQAALQKFQELLFDKLVETDDLSTGDLMKLSIAMKTGLNAQQIIGELRDRFDQAARKLTDVRRAITNEDIAAVRKAVFG